jgi:hypothetical protein
MLERANSTSEVTAPLRNYLIFDLNRVRSCALERSYCVTSVERVSKPCFSVNNQRQINGVANCCGMLHKLVETDKG